MIKKNLMSLSLLATFILGAGISAMATITGISSDGYPVTENRVQTPASASASKLITVPDISWGVSNVGTSEVAVAFYSQLLSNNQVLDTRNTVGVSPHPGATRDFTFHRQRSAVRVIRFAPPNQAVASSIRTKRPT